MKKTIPVSILLSVLFLFPARDTFAQISVGFRAGTNFSNFKTPKPVKFETKTGVNAALLLNIPFNKYLSLQLEPGYSQRGVKFDIDGQRLVDSAWQKTRNFGRIFLGYVEVPILLQYKPKIGRFEGIVSLGPEFRFCLRPQKIKSNTWNYKDGELVEDIYGEYDLTKPNAYRAFDFGLAGGAGVAYPLKFGKIFTEARYHLGLRRVSGADLYNRGASVHVGVLIPLKK